MKKTLLSVAAMAIATSAFAAVEVGFMNSEALGLAGKPTLADGTVLVETENVTMVFPFGQETSAQNPDFNGFKTVVVNGEEIALVQGIGGTVNGSANLLDGPSAGGCIYQFDVKKDGWLVVPSKISSNKNFYVYEGLVGAEPLPLAYSLGMDIQSADYPDVTEAKYTLPADELGYVNLDSPEIDKYTFGGTTIAWPIRIQTQNAEAVSAGNGTGAIVFPVYAEAGHYLVFATGSKMNTCGFVFVDSDPAGAAPQVAVYGTVNDEQKVVNITGEWVPGTDAIVNVAADAAFDDNAPVYNLLGQPVSKDAKGILIQNGRKFMNL